MYRESVHQQPARETNQQGDGNEREVLASKHLLTNVTCNWQIKSHPLAEDLATCSKLQQAIQRRVVSPSCHSLFCPQLPTRSHEVVHCSSVCSQSYPSRVTQPVLKICRRFKTPVVWAQFKFIPWIWSLKREAIKRVTSCPLGSIKQLCIITYIYGFTSK